MNLTEKLIKILKDTGSIQKEGTNTSVGKGYKYFSEAQLMGELRHRFAAEGILFVTDVISQETKEVERNTKNGVQKYAFVTVQTKHTFSTTIQEESVKGYENLEIKSFGQGIDSGDKAIYKAITGATKYALMKLFMITDHQDPEGDPEPDSFVPKKQVDDFLVITPQDAIKKIRSYGIPENWIVKKYGSKLFQTLEDFPKAELEEMSDNDALSAMKKRYESETK